MIVLGTALAGGCGDDESTQGEGGEGLVFARAGDGSTFTISDASVTCGRTDTSAGRPQAIFVTGPPEIFDDAGSDTPGGPFFRLEAIVADVSPSGTVKFPDEVYSDGAGASLFAADPGDPKGGAFEAVVPETGGANELSSSEEEARGEIIFELVTCSPRPEIAFTVDARLGSEFFEQPSLIVDGSFRGSGDPR